MIEIHRKDGKVYTLYVFTEKDGDKLYGAVYYAGTCVKRTSAIYTSEESALDAAFALAKSL